MSSWRAKIWFRSQSRSRADAFNLPSKLEAVIIPNSLLQIYVLKSTGCVDHTALELRAEAFSDLLAPLDHKNTPIIGVDDNMAGLKVPIRAPGAHKCSSWCRIILGENYQLSLSEPIQIDSMGGGGWSTYYQYTQPP